MAKRDARISLALFDQVIFRDGRIRALLVVGGRCIFHPVDWTRSRTRLTETNRPEYALKLASCTQRSH